jgi:hypothetical protein
MEIIGKIKNYVSVNTMQNNIKRNLNPKSSENFNFILTPLEEMLPSSVEGYIKTIVLYETNLQLKKVIKRIPLILMKSFENNSCSDTFMVKATPSFQKIPTFGGDPFYRIEDKKDKKNENNDKIKNKKGNRDGFFTRLYKVILYYRQYIDYNVFALFWQ